MKICRFNDDRLGLVEGESIRDVSEALNVIETRHYPFPTHDLLIERLPALRREIARLSRHAPSHPIRDVRLLCPVGNPGKLIGAPVNYQAHMDEAIEDPATFAAEQVRRVRDIGLFLKATSSLIGPSERIELVHEPRRTDHEVELAVVIGTTCRNVAAAEALNFVAGYTIGLDITLRGPEERSLRKSPDSYSVLGPWLVTADEIDDPGGLDLSLSVDGVVRQKSNTSKLLVAVPELIEFASTFYTLHPGDIIFTGTPEGVGPLLRGAQVHVSIEQIGEMTLHVSHAGSVEPVSASSGGGRGRVTALHR